MEAQALYRFHILKVDFSGDFDNAGVQTVAINMANVAINMATVAINMATVTINMATVAISTRVQIMPITVLQALPDFQTLQWLCLYIHMAYSPTVYRTGTTTTTEQKSDTETE